MSIPCEDCKKLVVSYAKWNTSLIPKTAIPDDYVCEDCGIEYIIYNGMIKINSVVMESF